MLIPSLAGTNDFPLEVDPTLPPGAHTLTVVYTDIFNQTSEQTISFNVAGVFHGSSCYHTFLWKNIRADR